MRIRLNTNCTTTNLCALCGKDTDLVDAKQFVSRSVDIMVKLCRVPCVPPITLVVSGYSYDVEPWEIEKEETNQ